VRDIITNLITAKEYVMADYVDDNAHVTTEVELSVEEMEEVIAPTIAGSSSIDVETMKLKRERLELKALQRALTLYRC
jgi:hypothetical protein